MKMCAPPKITSIDWGIKLSHISHISKTHPPAYSRPQPKKPTLPNLHPPPHTSLSLSLCGFHLILADFMLIEMTPNNLIHTCRSRLSLCQIFNAGCFHTNTWKLYYCRLANFCEGNSVWHNMTWINNFGGSFCSKPCSNVEHISTDFQLFSREFG